MTYDLDLESADRRSHRQTDGTDSITLTADVKGNEIPVLCTVLIADPEPGSDVTGNEEPVKSAKMINFINSPFDVFS